MADPEVLLREMFAAAIARSRTPAFRRLSPTCPRRDA
jgi:hypothetical protein